MGVASPSIFGTRLLPVAVALQLPSNTGSEAVMITGPPPGFTLSIAVADFPGDRIL